MAPESAVNKEFWWANKRQKQQDEGMTSGFDTYGKVCRSDAPRFSHTPPCLTPSHSPPPLHLTRCSWTPQLRDNVDKLRAFAALDPGPIVRPRRETPLTPEEQERLRQRRLLEQKPPDDATITSLFIGSVPPSVTKRDLMPFLLAYGELRDLTMDPNKLCAYVTFQRRSDAEQACKALYSNLTVKNTRLRVMWARRGKAKPRGDETKPGGEASEAPPPPPPIGGAAAAGKGTKRPLPPGVRLPPGVKPGVAYPSTNPDSFDANPAA